MANFSAKEVNELRKSTGVGIMDCRVHCSSLTPARKRLLLLRRRS